ncbi:hypothetical protein XM57_23955 [Burkholderia cepacia]|nr:hypothetical protein XM57_23955 [Burkholderia cepacia]AYZ94002.1 hypothetical protein EGY28_02205 [Burkholderia dolosa]ETP63702.1 hypothetical protein BDSB_17940 [Burkholderia dolosa PC543]PRE47925.1 hypothetical protein C6P87_16920 [Burkholderia sp. AU12872]
MPSDVRLDAESARLSAAAVAAPSRRFPFIPPRNAQNARRGRMRARGKSRERLAAPCAFTHAEKPSGPTAPTADF